MEKGSAIDYEKIIDERAQEVFDAMAGRVSAEDLMRIKRAFGLARGAHWRQKRKSGEPYILHPIAVAKIAAKELNLDANPVIAAFLHDVVEDTNYCIEDIQRIFGDDVAFLVRVVTKQKKAKYEMSKQLDNFKQMLGAVEYDIRALLVKLADRLHNMRTLSSMRSNKQMKIAGETDYFYAPLANRLGLYHVKTELENLSLKFRCPDEYADLCRMIKVDEDYQRGRLQGFCTEIEGILSKEGIKCEVYVEYRKPYSLWRKMRKFGDDFNHLKYRHFTEVVFEPLDGLGEKDTALRIYSLLTDRFKEKPGGIVNYIDSPKENGYQSFHVKLLADFGRWQEVHISSRRMIRDSQLGVMAHERSEDNIQRWIEKFRGILKDLSRQGALDSGSFMESVATSFYNDDIMVFTPKGKPIILPQRATALDFAFEVHTQLGMHAKYARINNQLASIKTRLHRGDVVEIFTDPQIAPGADWSTAVLTYKAKKAISAHLRSVEKGNYVRCGICCPIPGEEVVGFKQQNGTVLIHKRDCTEAIKLATEMGDSIVDVDFKADSTLYPQEISIRAVDRYHLFIDLVGGITNDLGLNIDGINTDVEDSIVDMRIKFAVHSYSELRKIMEHISKIEGVDEVKRL